MVSSVYAAYLRNIPITVHQPDGSVIECYATGDEYYNWLHDKDGYTIIQSQSDGYYYYAERDGELLKPSQYRMNEINPGSFGFEKWLKISIRMLKERRNNWFRDTEGRDAPSSGVVNNLNIFIRFADEYEFVTPRSYYDQPYNREEGPSLKHYFRELSYDTLTVNTPHYPVCDLSTNISYQDSLPRSYYQPYNEISNPDGYQGGDNGDDRRFREHTLLKSAIEFIQSEIPDTLVVDSDGDGYVDNTSFLISGSPGGWASLLWPHRWSLYTDFDGDGVGYDVYIKGKAVDAYNFNLAGDPTYFNVGTLCHEFGHSLGAPDLYHYSYDGRVPMGGWDLMEANSDPPQYMSAFMKWKYCNWIAECPIIESTGSYTLNPAQSPDNNCFRINSPYTDDEHFILEYRKKEGMYEVGTPGYDSGLLVYRINTVVGNGNADGPPDELYVYRPSGTLYSNGDISRASFNQSSGRREFNDSTNPSCFLTNGEPGGVNIIDIGYADNTIQFTYQTLSLFSDITNITDEGDGDGVLNPGDDATLQIFISNPLPNYDVNNVTGVLSTVEENVIIYNGEIPFEDLTIDNPEDSAIVNVTFLPDAPLGDIPFTFQITAEYEENGSEFDYSVEYHFNVAISLNQTGFPYGTTDQVRTSPAVIDINGDGIQEIIFGEDIGLLHVLGPTGVELPGFPFNLGGDDIWGSPAVADLEGDGDVEIIIGSKNKHLFVLNADGSIQVDYDAEQFLMGTPALGDIDGDGELEIVFGGYTSSGKLFAVNPDGSNVPGFPYDLGEKIQRGVALTDFNGNGRVDIVCGTDSGHLWLIYDDLTVADGFPFEVSGDFRTAPSILDANGEKIIFSGNNDNNFYAISDEGGLRFQVETGDDVNTSPGFVETEYGIGIFFGSDDGFIYGVNLNGDPLPGWPIDLNASVHSSPVFSDLDGDGEVEVITATVAGNLYALRLDGSTYPHFPISGSVPYRGSPAVQDIDGDNDNEILIGSSGGLEIIDIKEQGSIDGYWNMHRGNLSRTGYIELETTTVPGIFSNTINVSGGNTDYDLVFGFSPYATDGYDSGIDLYAPPPPPPNPPVFDAALGWDNDRYYTQILYGPAQDTVGWDVQLQYPEDNTIILTWDNTGWDTLSTFILQDAFGGLLGIDVDMTVENSLTLTDPMITILKLKVIPGSLSIFNENDLKVPQDYSLFQNYPNPFNPVTQITYSIPQQSYIVLEIFDLTGAHMKTLVDGKQNSGMQTVQWDGTDKNGILVGTGVYLYRINSNTFSQTRKMVLIK